MGDDQGKGLHPIGSVVEQTKVPATTLRRWEEAYGLVVPARAESGRRFYSDDDIKRIQWLKHKIDEGVEPSAAHELLAQELGKIVSVVEEAKRKGALLILVAEKDPITAELEHYFLDREGYDVHVVLDGREAIEKAEALQPDLIVLDVILPGLSGLKVCKALRMGEKTKHIPILVFSVLAVEDRALAAGADAFLLKPIDQPKLIKAVKALLTMNRKRTA
jgi:CheY-like chemotaxis protein